MTRALLLASVISRFLVGCECGPNALSLHPDGGHRDSGVEVTGTDSGAHDDDAGSDDAGLDDAGLDDAGFDDAGFDDAGLDDAGLDDAGLDDAGLDDAGLDDAGLDDAGLDDAGAEDAGLVTPPYVIDFAPTSTGFRVSFDHGIDRSKVNLVRRLSDGGLTSSDLSVVRMTDGGVIRGSAVLNSPATQLTFLVAGGLLPVETFAVTLRSADDGFCDVAGLLLDGNHDGDGGDDFTTVFNTGVGYPRVSVPDVVRGPGQPVDAIGTALTPYLPVFLVTDGGATVVDFTLLYDPSTLVVLGHDAGVSLLSNVSVVGTFSNGAAVFHIESATPLAAGQIELVQLVTTVPPSAAYGWKRVLDVENVLVNGVPAIDDDGLQLVAFVGDVSGSGDYSVTDATLIQRVALGLDDGFAAFPNVSPVSIGDVDGNLALSATDGTRVAQESAGNDRPEIPPLPDGGVAITFSGPDPFLFLTSQSISNSGVVRVSVRVAPSDGLQSVEMEIAYNPMQLQILEVERTALTRQFQGLIDIKVPGRIRVDIAALEPLRVHGTKAVFEIVARAVGGARKTTLDVQRARLNDGHLVIGRPPRVGSDSADGLIIFGRPPGVHH